MDKVTEMIAFARVVELQSFSAAARKLDLSTPVVSKYVSRLEDRLQVRLLNRTTRKLSLTEAGAALYTHCARIIEEIGLAEERMERMHEQPTGKLKVTCTLTFGSMHVAPLLPAFLERYPHIEVALSLNDRLVDIAAEGYDLAIRFGRRVNTGLVARKLASIRNVVCAAPAYLARRGTPLTPQALVQHNCLRSFMSDQDEWTFSAPEGGRIVARVNGNLQVNSGGALRSAALQGLGIIRVASYIVGHDLHTGQLVQVLPEYELPGNHIQAIYVPTPHLPAKLRVFIDFLVENFSHDQYWR